MSSERRMNMKPFLETARLGIDIGRVIIAGGTAHSDTSFIGGSDEDAMRTPAMPGCVEVISDLVRAFGGRVWLVSKCGPRVQARSRRWLAQRHFHAETG